MSFNEGLLRFSFLAITLALVGTYADGTPKHSTAVLCLAVAFGLLTVMPWRDRG